MKNILLVESPDGPKGIVITDGSKDIAIVTGREANLLLFLLDAYIGGLRAGCAPLDGYFTAEMLKPLRERLFQVHEHPKEEGE